MGRSKKKKSTPKVTYRAKNYLCVIAINDYEHIEPLNNCVRDAEAVIKLLTEDFEFERSDVSFVCSGPLEQEFRDIAILEDVARDQFAPHAKATRKVIFDELRRVGERIKADQEEDKDLKVNLILYYSGHGWYDEFLDQGYWIPVDSELDDYSKYISNSTIRDFLSGFPTHHTVLISDSCFSGSLFASGTGKSLASTRLEKDPSRWGITAGRNEVVSDGTAGQHSPFIEGMLTELRKNDIITIQDLSSKVTEWVASSDKQTPRGEPLRVRGHKGGQFVFRKKANARKHFRAGQLILRLAKYRPEYASYRAAALQFELAGRLSKKAEDQAKYLLWEARSLGYAGLYEDALEALDRGLNNLPAAQDTAALETTQQVLGWLKQPELLAERLGREKLPTQGNWSQALTSLYRAQTQTSKDLHILSIGVDENPHLEIPSLESCRHDAELLTKTLLDTFGEQRSIVNRLFGTDATKAGVIQTLEDLIQDTSEDDAVIIYISTVGMLQPKGEEQLADEFPFLIVQDSKRSSDPNQPLENAIGYRELHDLLQAIPARDKIVIIDAEYNEQFHELAQTGNYTLLQGTAEESERAKLLRVEDREHGIFTYNLVQAIREHPDRSAREQERKITKAIVEKIGTHEITFHKADLFFDAIRYMSLDALPLFGQLLEIIHGQRRVRSKEERQNIKEAIDFLKLEFSAEGWQRLAEQLPDDTEAALTIDFYERSLQLYRQRAHSSHTAKDQIIEIRLALAQQYGKNGAVAKALTHLQAAHEALGEDDQVRRLSIREKIIELEQLSKRKKHALLVGITTYANLGTEEGVNQDLDNWKSCLLKRGYLEEDIIILKDEKATKKAILAAFTQLAEQAEEHPAFFFFGGLGTSYDHDQYQQGLCAYETDDTQFNSIIWFAELASRCPSATHLTSVVDAGFRQHDERYHAYAGEKRWLLGSHQLVDSFGPKLFLPGAYHEKEEETQQKYFAESTEQGGVLSTMLCERLSHESTTENLIAPYYEPAKPQGEVDSLPDTR